MADIFLSYAREDRDVAECVARAFKACGWTVWWDRHIQTGRRFPQVIERELAAARCVVALWSTAAVASHWVREEAQDGLDRDILVPAKIEEVTAPLGFRTVQAVDLCGWQGAAVDPCMTSLVEDIARLLGGPISSDVMAAPSPGASAPPSPASGRGLVTPATVAPVVKQEPLPPGEVGANAPGEGAAAPRTADQIPTTPHIHIGVDPRRLPDLAIFKDIDAPWCPEMVIIPAGSFLMGSPPSEEGRNDDEAPQHRVVISKRFAIGRYAVTFDEYDHFCEITEREKPMVGESWDRGRLPVVNVSWHDAYSYLQWLTAETGQLYRLPTEAEWEYACRAETTTPYSFGETISVEQVNFGGFRPYGSSKSRFHRGRTVPVGTLPPNPWGIFEMHGNIWEWCRDGKRKYSGRVVTDPLGSEDYTKGQVIRGGSFVEEDILTRSAVRIETDRGDPSGNIGFRCARTVE